jgi:hypothetical protein
LYPLLMTAICGGFYINGVMAQVESSSSSSSSTTTEETIKGYAFKYKQRFDNYAEQIDMGVSKGWLTAAEANGFKTRLAELRSVEATANKAGYPADQIANLDKLTTKFNEDLSSSSQKTAATSGGASEETTKTEVSGAKTKTETRTKKTTKKTK